MERTGRAVDDARRGWGRRKKDSDAVSSRRIHSNVHLSASQRWDGILQLEVKTDARYTRQTSPGLGKQMNNQPKKTSGDTAHTLAKAVLSAVPAIGGPLSVLFESVFTEPIEKRKQEWLARLALSIDLLTKKINDLTTERLSKDQVFISVAFHASQVALRCHQAEKLEALQHQGCSTLITSCDC